MRRTLPLVAFLSVLLSCAGMAHAGPDNHTDPPPNWLADTIATDRTITFASPGPTYFVYGDLTVLPGVTLTIEPGVTLTFAGDSDFMVSGSHLNRAELLVRGTLSALAPGGARIKFESNSGSQRWGGVTVFGTGAGHFRNVMLEFVTTALRVDGPSDLDSCVVTNATAAIRLGANVTVDHTTIVGSEQGIVYSPFSSGNLLMMRSNMAPASNALNILGSGTVVVLQFCTITGGGLGLVEGASALTMTDCSSVTNNGLALASDASFAATNTQITTNSAACIQSSSTGPLTLTDVGLTSAGATCIQSSSTGPLTLTDVGLTSSGCGGYALMVTGAAPVDLRRVTISARRFGAYLASVSGTIRQLTVERISSACGGGDDGVSLGAGVVFPVDDSTSVVPSTIKNFSTGVSLSGPAHLRNVLIAGAAIGVAAGNHAVELNYCTLVAGTGVNSAGAGTAIYNSIINATTTFSGGTSDCRGVAYSDLWPLADAVAPWCNGGQVASFDPGFVGSGPLPYKLDPSSLFIDFSVSGREIGAYGPGPGPAPASVGNEGVSSRPLRVSPNPSLDGRFAVSFATHEGGDFLLEAFDLSGRRVWSKNLRGLVPGDHSAVVGTTLSKGVYWLRVRGVGLQASRRFVVVG